MKLFSCLALGTLLASLSSIAAASGPVSCQELNLPDSPMAGKCAWVPYHSGYGAVSSETVYGGTENGYSVHVCRDNSGTVGKLINGTHCWVPWYGKEYRQDSYEILKVKDGSTHYRWDRVTSPISVFNNEVMAGKDSGNATYICRVYDNRSGDYTVGKFIRGEICFYPHGGHEYAADPRHQDPLYVDVLRYVD